MAGIARAHGGVPEIVGTLPHWIEGVYLITRVEIDGASDGVSQQPCSLLLAHCSLASSHQQVARPSQQDLLSKVNSDLIISHCPGSHAAPPALSDDPSTTADRGATLRHTCTLVFLFRCADALPHVGSHDVSQRLHHCRQPHAAHRPDVSPGTVPPGGPRRASIRQRKRDPKMLTPTRHSLSPCLV